VISWVLTGENLGEMPTPHSADQTTSSLSDRLEL
jgi:hypothetical protein